MVMVRASASRRRTTNKPARGNERARGEPPAQSRQPERAKHEETVMPKLKTNRGAAKRFAQGMAGSSRPVTGATSSRRSRRKRKRICAARAAEHRRLRRRSGCAAAAVRLRRRYMARVKRGVTARRASQKGPRAGEGLLQRPPQSFPRGEAGRHQGRPVCVSRPARAQARVPRAVDHAHQRAARVHGCRTAT